MIYDNLFVHIVSFSLQIIIEAVSGQTRVSDIAFDDFSLLADEECSEKDESITKSPTVTDTDDAINSPESCAGRCFRDDDYDSRTLNCSCSVWCHSQSTCCLDFLGKLRSYIPLIH